MQQFILYGLKQLATVTSGLGKNKKLFILIFHRVLDEPDYMRPGEVDKSRFTWQMRLLSKYFNVLPLADALVKMQSNSLPARAVCITFDDGYSDNYLNALPILKQFQLSATFFIASGYLNGGCMWNDTIIETLRRHTGLTLDLTKIQLGIFNTSTKDEKVQAASQIILKIKHLTPEKRAEFTDYISSFAQELPNNLMMTDEQLIKLHQSGMEIGGHTVTHPIMAKMPVEQVQHEVDENQQSLDSLLKTQTRFFAYPNGKPGSDYLPEQVQLIKDAGYLGAVSTQWGVATKSSDLFQLPRFTPWDNSPIRFMLRMIKQLFQG